ncbi:MAG: hypothetical protein OXN89_16195 [Bryobacterales bacterium]|nr:hypothetical protein [Bryobacterales bacterium]
MRPSFWILGVALASAGSWVGIPALLTSSAEAQSPTRSESACQSAPVLALRLGIGDDAESDWHGKADGWVASGTASWEANSQSSPTKLAGGALSPRVLPAEVVLKLPDGECTGVVGHARTISVETGQGRFEIHLDELEIGSFASFLGGRVEASLNPSDTPLTTSGLDDDFPSCAALVDGSVVCAYVEYEPGALIDEEAALAGRFESLEFSGNGDRIKWVHRIAGGWSEAIEVTPGGRDVWRPAVMALPTGGAAVVWSEQRSGNWDIYAREYSRHSGDFGPERRITQHPGSDINVAASGGFIAWQAHREHGFDIYASTLDGAPVRVSQSDANDWRPSIAADRAGSAWIAWDTYQSGNYDVLIRRFDGESVGEVIPIATSGRFEARASVAVDEMGRAWVAFEDSDEGWGKDYGDRWPGTQATPMYVNKNLLVRVWDGALRQTALPPLAPTVDYYHDDPRIATSQRNKISIPVLTFDGNGLPWIFYRRHPLKTGRGEVWRSYGAYYAGGSWSRPIPLQSSDHVLDRSPGLAGLPDGSLLAVIAGDARTNARERQDSDLHSAVLRVGAPAIEPKLVPTSANQPDLGADPVHPDEAAQIAALRARRIRAGSLSLQFLRGEFHRHSAFSSHRDWDGPFEDVWRYGLDVAALDWIGPGDHDYAVGQDYQWWLQQKASDMFHHAGHFSATYTYERNVSYPSGHRNVMLPRRGIRPVPRMRGRENMNGTAEEGAPDIKNLFAYLRHFGGICSSHTSASNMGTDWRDGDTEVEPVVEIFQGHRQSYELSGGPFAATGPEDTIQGYRPAGYVWEAFQKGRRLGFQASSDHVSTHISYAIVLAEENSREAIIDAFKRRHSYAAQDNIALLVQSGEHLMGDEFKSSGIPRLQITATGTTEIDSVEIVRQVGLEKPAIVAAMEPRAVQVNLEWSDPAAKPGEWNMYYVRMSQRNKAMAWASPMWIRYEP